MAETPKSAIQFLGTMYPGVALGSFLGGLLLWKSDPALCERILAFMGTTDLQAQADQIAATLRDLPLVEVTL